MPSSIERRRNVVEMAVWAEDHQRDFPRRTAQPALLPGAPVVQFLPRFATWVDWWCDLWLWLLSGRMRAPPASTATRSVRHVP
jgi:hypothetical protein